MLFWKDCICSIERLKQQKCSLFEIIALNKAYSNSAQSRRLDRVSCVPVFPTFELIFPHSHPNVCKHVSRCGCRTFLHFSHFNQFHLCLCTHCCCAVWFTNNSICTEFSTHSVSQCTHMIVILSTTIIFCSSLRRCHWTFSLCVQPCGCWIIFVWHRSCLSLAIARCFFPCVRNLDPLESLSLPLI